MFLIFCFCMVFIFPVKGFSGYGNHDEQIICSVEIKIKGGGGNEIDWAGIAQTMIFIRQGEPFSDKSLYESVAALKKSHFFEKIKITGPLFKDHKGSISFHLTPFPLIKNIKIVGGFPLLKREIMAVMKLFAGGGFSKKQAVADENFIAELFREQGYISPKVNISAAKDSICGWVNMVVNIDKGSFYRIRSLRISGNRVFSDQRLKVGSSAWRSSLLFGEIKRFREKKFKKDLDKLLMLYRHKGYFEVRVDSKVEKNSKTGHVYLFIIIDEGPKYQILFKGNREFMDFTLKKEVVLFKEGNPGGLGLRKSIRKIKQRYLKKGFLDIRVASKVVIKEGAGKNLRQIRFTIDEGAEYILDSITIMGNHRVEAEEIKEQMLTKMPGFFSKGLLDNEILEEDLGAITSLYLKKGYTSARVAHHLTWREDAKNRKRFVNVALNIKEEGKVVVSSVRIKCSTCRVEEEGLSAVALKKNDPFRRYMMLSDENLISVLLSEKGYPHAKVKGRVTMDKTGALADVIYEITQGPFVSMGEVFCKGNLLTKERVIKYGVELNPGEAFSLSKILASQQNIRNINTFDSVRFKLPGLAEKKENVNMLVEVEEKKPYYIRVKGGYDTKRLSYGHTRLGCRNLFGLNKEVWTSFELSEIGYRSDVAIREPRLFLFPVSSTLKISFEEQEELNKDFGTRTFAGSLGFSHSFFKNYRAKLALNYERQKQFQRTGILLSSEEKREFKPRSILVTRSLLTYNSTDSFFRPKKGIYSSLSLDISRGIDNSLDNFFKYRFEVRKFYTLFSNLTFGLRGRAGFVDSFGKVDVVPDGQLFFLGGASDVRGFDENMLVFDSAGNAVGGRTELLGSIEARIYLGLNFEITMFYDTGSLQNTHDYSGSHRFRSSTGLGMHYITPAGSLGVIYGYKLDRKDYEDRGRFHFVLGYTF